MLNERIKLQKKKKIYKSKIDKQKKSKKIDSSRNADNYPLEPRGKSFICALCSGGNSLCHPTVIEKKKRSNEK